MFEILEHLTYCQNFHILGHNTLLLAHYSFLLSVDCQFLYVKKIDITDWKQDGERSVKYFTLNTVKIAVWPLTLCLLAVTFVDC